jgi:hypothetical protein
VVLANGWADTKIAESVHELRERSSFSAEIELATRAISQSIAELECAPAGSKGKGSAERTSRQRGGGAFAPAVRRAKDFKLVPQEMPQSKM